MAWRILEIFWAANVTSQDKLRTLNRYDEYVRLRSRWILFRSCLGDTPVWNLIEYGYHSYFQYRGIIFYCISNAFVCSIILSSLSEKVMRGGIRQIFNHFNSKIAQSRSHTALSISTNHANSYYILHRRLARVPRKLGRNITDNRNSQARGVIRVGL